MPLPSVLPKLIKSDYPLLNFFRLNVINFFRRNSALLVLLFLTAVVYMWRIGINGVSNSYYSAVVWSSSKSWSAWFFGAEDPRGIITADKPPGSTWWMGFWTHIFGYSATISLIPQAILAMITVGLIWSIITRLTISENESTTKIIALSSCLVFIFLPANTLMFRHSNPDAMLTMLVTLGCYLALKASEQGNFLAYAGTGMTFGFAFLTKDLEGLVIVPAIGLFLLIFTSAPLQRRLIGLLIALSGLITSIGWYVLAVQLTPADQRPYIGGSEHNSILDLAFGYNGLARVKGMDNGPINAIPVFGGGESSPSFYRLMTNEFGMEIGWVLPAALIASIYLIVITWKKPLSDGLKKLTWLLIACAYPYILIFSLMGGVIHPYYVVVLSPSLSALTALGVITSFRNAGQLRIHAIFAGIMSLTLILTTWSLLDRYPHWFPIITVSVVCVGIIALCGWGISLSASPYKYQSKKIPLICAFLGLFMGIITYSISIVNRPITSGLPHASPEKIHIFDDDSPLEKDPPKTAILLLQQSNTYWSAATTGALSSSYWELNSRTPVIDIGGFIGHDPAPTLAQFQNFVRHNQIRYFIPAEMPGPKEFNSEKIDKPNTECELDKITHWVKNNFHKFTVKSFVFYDLFAPITTSYS